MAQFSKARWPADGAVRVLLEYLDQAHRTAGQPSLSDIGRAVALAPSTLSAFFTGTRLISQGNLELVVSYLDGDTELAERLRRQAATAWNAQRADARTIPQKAPPVDPAQPATSDTDLETGTDEEWAGYGGVDVVFFDSPVNKMNRPAELVGRAEHVERLTRLLDAGEQVLLHGLGGSGKTSLAATVADARVADGRGPYLWLRVSTADEDVLFDAMLRRLATTEVRRQLAALTGDERLLAIQEVVRRSGVALCVLDDVWHPAALHSVVHAVPVGIPVLVTSRLKLGLRHVIEVAGLPPAEATQLLAEHAQREAYAWDAEADALCQLLGGHPYALEIAGHQLRQYAMTPAELREAIADAPHLLAVPGGFAAAGRESIASLLERSYQALAQPDARLVLAAFGALYASSATIDLLAAYLDFPLARTRVALNVLVDLSLARRRPDSPSYEVHDLTFSYARTLAGPGPRDHRPVIAAVRATVVAHAGDYPVLAADMPNILGAAAQARTADPDSFVAIVEAIAGGGFLDDHGHTLGLLRLLDDAIEEVRGRGPEQNDRLHVLLSKRGNALNNQGELTAALASYHAALVIAPTPARQIILLAVIGKVLTFLDRYADAERHFAQAYEIAEARDDPDGLLRIIEQHSHAAFVQERFDTVRELSLRGIELSRSVGARTAEAILLNNLGSAEYELGVRASLQRHRAAHEIASALNDEDMLALTHRTLGIDHHAREDFAAARGHFGEALRLYEKLGQAERAATLRAMMETFGYA